MKSIKYWILLILISALFVSCSQVSDSDKGNENNVPTIVKLGRDDCQPCVEMNRILKNVSDQMGNKADIRIINIEENPDSISRFGISAIPTTIFFDLDGKERYRFKGVIAQDKIIEYISKCEVMR
jgi:thioredoxin 1